MERGEHRDHPVGGGAHVHDRRPRAERLAAGPGHEGEPRRHLGQLVEEGARLVRAGEEALERKIDDARVGPGQDVVAQAEGLHRAVGEVVDDHVRGGHEPQEERAGLRRPLEVDRDRALVAVEEVKVGRGAGRHPARLVALGGALDLDDVGPQVGEQEARGRPRDDVAQLEDAQALER